MKPMTKSHDAGGARIEAGFLSPCDDGSFAGPAAERLAAWEAALAQLEQEYAEACVKVDELKASPGARRATAQQLVAQKMALAQTLSRFGELA